MAVRIGSARIGENGKVTGGKPGDQTKHEVETQNWYQHSKGWYVLRARDGAAAARIAQAMREACANQNIGYNQNERNTLYALAKAVAWVISKVANKSNTDCSALVRVCLAAAGIMVQDFTTANQVAVIMATGLFDKLSSAKYCKSPDYLEEGDILVTRTKGHTAVVLNDGSKADEGQMGDASRNPYPKPTKLLKKGSKGSGVKWVQKQFALNGYGTVLVDGRPKDVHVDGDFGPITLAAVKAFQRAHRDAQGRALAVDGIVGKLTRNALDGPSAPAAQPGTPAPQREAVIVDISQHNNMKHAKNDWAKIAASVDMLIVRCGVTRTYTKPLGIGVDAEFTYIAKKCAEYGIPMGVYYYGKVKSVEDARREADKCWETASPFKPLLYAYDVEESRLSNAMVEAWMDQMAVRGADPERVGLYLAHHLYDQFKAAAKKAAFLWIPRYGKNNGKLDRVPAYACDIHQYTSVGDGHKLGFYDDTVDLNRLCGSKGLAWFTRINEGTVD